MQLNEKGQTRKNVYFFESLSKPNWQYHIYNLGRYVIKISKSHSQIVRAIKLSRWGKRLDESKTVALATEVAKSSGNSLNVVQRNPAANELCGFPCVLPAFGYLQRSGTSFLDAYATGVFEVETIIDDFFELNTSLWEVGVFEKTFDLFRNCGYLSGNQKFLLDLGDITDNFEEACSVLGQERWKDRLDFKVLDSAAKKYYLNQASKIFEESFIAKIWRKKI